MPPTTNKTTTHPLVSVDPKAIRRRLRTLIRSQEQIHPRDTPLYARAIINDIWQFIESARTQQPDEHSHTLLTLQAITDVCTEKWMYLNNIHGEVSDFIEDLASIWTEEFLSCDLTTKERTHWAKHLSTWQTRLVDMHMDTAFDAPQAAIREGWDHPSLKHILQGTPPQQSVRSGEIPASVTVLTQARLAVLEQRQQFEEYLRLARAEGQTRDYIVMAVRQGQIAEAIAYGQDHLTTAKDTFAFAQALFAANEHAQSLQIARHGLTLEGDSTPLAVWLRDHAWSMGEQMIALEAGEVAFRGEPTLEHYQRVALIAGNRWIDYRAKFLEQARHAPFTANPRSLIRLFLHEHLFEDAIGVLKTNNNHILVAQIVDAALEEQVELEWVIQACRAQAEHIMNGAKASYYQAATNWLIKARTAYHLLGRDEIWQAYLNELLERHRYKSKLLPLLKTV